MSGLNNVIGEIGLVLLELIDRHLFKLVMISSLSSR